MFGSVIRCGSGRNELGSAGGLYIARQFLGEEWVAGGVCLDVLDDGFWQA